MWLACVFAFLAVSQIKGREAATAGHVRAQQYFKASLDDYIRIRRQAEERLGRTLDFNAGYSARDVVDREHALAQYIREIRTVPTEGEIFTPEVRAYLSQALNIAYDSNPQPITASLACVSEIVEQRLTPNSVYPEDWEYNMMPPTLLLGMPALPQGLEYRIVNRDMIIRDLESNLVVDVMRNAITFPLEGAQCDE